MQIKKNFQKKHFYKKKINKNIKKFNKNNQLNNQKYSVQFNKVDPINPKTLLKKKKPKITNYLHVNQKLKQGIFLKKPSFNEIIYPFSLNLKLINEYLKKK